MAREKKPVELRPVDDDVAPVVNVMRLVNRDTGPNPGDEKPVRLGVVEHDGGPSRLDVPTREEMDLRTHQPGIEILMESELGKAELDEENWGQVVDRRNPIPWGWFVLIGLAVVGAVVWSLAHVKQADVQADHIREEAQSALAREMDEEREAGELVDRIETSLRVFFSATTVESLVRGVRQPERVEPLIRKYYARIPVFDSPLRSMRVLQPLTLDRHADFWMASVTLNNGHVRNLIVEIDSSGTPRIDWETLVCHQPMPWDEFSRERPVGVSLDFRVYAERDSFFSHEFGDSGRWLCFRLTALDSEEALFGYLPVQSPDAAIMQGLLEANDGHKVSVILRLGIPQGLQSRKGVVIEKVVNSRWLYLDPPENSL